MPDNMINANDSNFQDTLKENPSSVVDFTAAWCGPCKRLAPVIEELAKEYAGKIKFIKCDVDDSPDTASKFQVMSVPTLLFLKNGEEEDRTVGLVPADKIKEKLQLIL